MIKDGIFKSGEDDKILIPAPKYDSREDTRLLIPFTEERHIGFMDKSHKVIVPPKYNMYYEECYSENDYIVVEKIVRNWVPNKGESFQHLQGLINHKGETIFPCEYTKISPAKDPKKNIFTVKHPHEGCAVVTVDGEMIIPYGEYQDISGYTKGFARVRQNGKYGIIDETGKVVVPIEYSTIWNFYKKDWYATKLEKDGKRYDFWFMDKRITLFD